MTLQKNLFTLVSLLSLCAPLCAQTDSLAAIREIDEVEVAASREGLAKPLAPRYSLSSRDFRLQNAVDLSASLRRLPGVVLRDYGGAGGMKTIAVRGLGSQHAAVALDGLVLPAGLSGQVDFQQFQLADVSNLRLSLAGADEIFLPARNAASGALVELESAADNSLALNAGSWGLAEATLRLSAPLGNWRLSGGATFSKAENDYPFLVENGLATHEERRTNSRNRQGNAHFSALWHGETTTLRAMTRLCDNDRELPGIVRLYTNENDETLRDRGALAQMQLSTRLAARWWAKGALRWHWNEQRYHNGRPSGGMESERYISREYYATASLLFQPCRALALDYSADFFRNAMTTSLAANPEPRRNSLLQSLAAKGDFGRLRMTGQLLLALEDDGGKKEHRLSPVIAASWRLLPGRELFLRLSAKDIFRMPSMNELYYYHIGPANLRPEKAQQLNVGLTCGRFAEPGTRGDERRWQAELAADVYLNRVSDKIVGIPFNMFVSRYMNLSSVLGRGADLCARARYNINKVQAIAFAANYSFQRVGMRQVGEAFRDFQTAYTPQHSGSASVAWENAWVNCSATLTGASRVWTNNEHNGEPIAAYKQVDISLFKDFTLGARRMETALAVQNLLGERYCLVAHYPMPGRSWRVTLKVAL